MADDKLHAQLLELQTRLRRQSIVLISQVVFITVVFCIGAIGINITQRSYDNDPRFQYELQYEEYERMSEFLNKSHPQKILEFNRNSSLKKILKQEDPQQLIIIEAINTERDLQDFILYLSRGLKELTQVIGGVDEWYFYQSKILKAFVAKSRLRQKSLRGMLSKRREQSSPF